MCLALKNGFIVPIGEILQMVRRVKINHLEKDPVMKPYLKVINLLL